MSAEISVDPPPSLCKYTLAAREYDLHATLTSGQVFNWDQRGGSWIGVIKERCVCLRQEGDVIHARTLQPQTDWSWLIDYLQTDVDLTQVLATFPTDPRLRTAMEACRGLRLLRQDPWECLACFILSSTKQIIQIRQIVAALRARFGTALTGLEGEAPVFAFPTAHRLAATTESELRACKMGFRAPYLLATARRVATGECNLQNLAGLPLSEARTELLKLPGVGEKIADCVLLFAYGFPTAFPIDVWVAKALRKFYFRGRRVPALRLREFAAAHFGPHAGYAQQYLFHYIRTQTPKKLSR